METKPSKAKKSIIRTTSVYETQSSNLLKRRRLTFGTPLTYVESEGEAEGLEERSNRIKKPLKFKGRKTCKKYSWRKPFSYKEKKPLSYRAQTNKRLVSNERERLRNHGLNDAFRRLQIVIPYVGRPKPLSKIETLSLAKYHIQRLTNTVYRMGGNPPVFRIPSQAKARLEVV